MIIKGRDNYIDIKPGSGLLLFDSVVLKIGSETYNTVDNPENLIVVDDQTLRLKIGEVTEVPTREYSPVIIGYNDENPNGLQLHGLFTKQILIRVYRSGYDGDRPAVNPLMDSNGGLFEGAELYEGIELYAG